MKILMIGNSYTYYNDMPEVILTEIFRSAGIDAEITALTKGGWKLEKSADPSDELGAKVAAAFDGNKYDYTVLQDHSLRATDKPESFFAAVKKLAERAKKNGSKVVLYETWARRDGNAKLKERGLTNESMTDITAKAYAAAENSAAVAHAGLAMRDVYVNHQEIELYNEDGSHPSVCGSYLAALCIFAAITGMSPLCVGFDGGTADPKTAKILREAANRAMCVK